MYIKILTFSILSMKIDIGVVNSKNKQIVSFVELYQTLAVKVIGRRLCEEFDNNEEIALGET